MPLMSVCESFGIPPIEAMSYGTPVIIADCCALPEVCGQAALKCPADDLNRLVWNLKNVLLDSDSAHRLQSAGFERVQQFSWEATARKMADELERITQL
jgi:glycosyltransferase involved in cell wall biosynthesis